MPRSLISALLCISVAAGFSLTTACSRPKPVVAPEPVPGAALPGGGQTGVSPESEVKPEPAIAPAGTPESGVSGSELPADLAELNKAGYLKDAFFDTDKSDLRSDTRDILAADAGWLKQHRTVKITIEGHCDERNTAEYNLALGWRRANAVKNYLIALGVDGGRINVISYGEERPFATCHNESCWVQNRRAHFVITAR